MDRPRLCLSPFPSLPCLPLPASASLSALQPFLLTSASPAPHSSIYTQPSPRIPQHSSPLLPSAPPACLPPPPQHLTPFLLTTASYTVPCLQQPPTVLPPAVILALPLSPQPSYLLPPVPASALLPQTLLLTSASSYLSISLTSPSTLHPERSLIPLTPSFSASPRSPFSLPFTPYLTQFPHPYPSLP